MEIKCIGWREIRIGYNAKRKLTNRVIERDKKQESRGREERRNREEI